MVEREGNESLRRRIRELEEELEQHRRELSRARESAERCRLFIRESSDWFWETDAEGTVHVRLLYDYERNSPNRAAGHWHFQLQGRPGAHGQRDGHVLDQPALVHG